MAVCAEDQLAGTDIILHHHLMTYAFALPEINMILFGKVPHFLLGSSGFRIIGGNVVVHNKHELLCVLDM